MNGRFTALVLPGDQKDRGCAVTELETRLLGAFDGYNVDEVRSVLDAGLDPRAPIEGKLPVERLTEEYMRSNGFARCLRLLLDHGASLADPALLYVLLNDGEKLAGAIDADATLLTHRTSMTSAFTSLAGATLLHVAAEYCHADAAHVLIVKGADVNARAAVDAIGLNGHSPIFHCVNSIGNMGAPILKMLLAAGARVDMRLDGIVWGQGYPWETTLIDVTPASYCQFGLLPQMHRREKDIYETIRLLLEAAGRPASFPNVPNRYLQPKGSG